ncbi:MAG TPA: ATP-dependent DNA ligase [Steroidobacteraceae bacterium]|jgi:ATP-dependent DNA ligase
MNSPAAPLLLPMEARLVAKLPEDGLWQFEPKWDGFRCMILKDGAKLELRSKSGKPLARYFPEIARGFAQFKCRRFVLDGELIIPVGSSLSFDALQMRLHPAHSRVVKLARDTPALFMAFDMLSDDGKELLSRPLGDRRRALERLYRREQQPAIMRLSPYSRDLAEARRWLGKAGGGALDGVVAKSLRGPYEPGERAMLKVKCLRTADCVVGGFRYATDSKQVGSMLLGLYNADGMLDHVGFSSGISARERPHLTRMFEKLRGGRGFTGSAPGGPSRWSTDRSTEWYPLKTKLVAEVQYDQVTGDRFRHGTRFLRWRPDKAPRQCTFGQLRQEVRPAKLLAALR